VSAVIENVTAQKVFNSRRKETLEIDFVLHEVDGTRDFHCPITKTGVIGGARVAKINELIRIEEVLGNRAEMSALSL
jgi:enolase